MISNDIEESERPGGDAPLAPTRPYNQWFKCRVAVEDIRIGINSSSNSNEAGNEIEKALWEELRANIVFNGVTQRTRWVSIPLGIAKAQSEKRQKENAIGSYTSRFVPEEHESNGEMGGKMSKEELIRKMTNKIVALPLTALNNCSFEADFQAENEKETEGKGSEPEANKTEAEQVPQSNGTNKVRSKKVHLLTLTVDALNDDTVFSSKGGITGEAKATSSNAEALGAAYQKGTSKISAWARSAFKKLSKDDEHDEQRKREKNENIQKDAMVNFTLKEAPGSVKNKALKGTYKTLISGIDLSEAYNAPGGRKRFHLMLRKEGGSSIPSAGEGVPVFVSFTVAVNFSEPKGSRRHDRNFHDFAILVDQMVLNLTEAAPETLPTSVEKGGLFAGKQAEKRPPRQIVGYGFGLTSNSFFTADCPAKSYIVPKNSIPRYDGSNVCVLDFASLLTKSEQEISKEDYKELPVSCCVVSSGCQVASPERIGARFVLMSRFKTSPEGLCKPSKKCQLTFSIFRKLESGELEEEAATDHPISLAGILNEEEYPQRVREIRFSLGEVLYFRLRRCCFANPLRNNAPLLLPFDYDNSSFISPAQGGEEEDLGGTARSARAGKDESSDSEKSDSSTSVTDGQEEAEMRQLSPSEDGHVVAPTPEGDGSYRFASEDARENGVPEEVSPQLDPENPFLSSKEAPADSQAFHGAPETSFVNPFESASTVEQVDQEDRVDNPYFYSNETNSRPTVEVTGMENFFNSFQDPSANVEAPTTTAAATFDNNYDFGASNAANKEEEEEAKVTVTSFEENSNPYKFD